MRPGTSGFGNLDTHGRASPGGGRLAGEPPGSGDKSLESRIRFEINHENDLLVAGREIWSYCQDLGFSSVESMQVRTAFSELARNILKFAQNGEVILTRIGEGGVRLLFIDEGPGISDIDMAMGYGFSTAKSLGLGLPGSKKLADNFEIFSETGKGTQITFEKHARKKANPRSTEEIRLKLDKRGLLRKRLWQK
jgi:serine/threonine-protein kinase RsbT